MNWIVTNYGFLAAIVVLLYMLYVRYGKGPRDFGMIMTCLVMGILSMIAAVFTVGTTAVYYYTTLMVVYIFTAVALIWKRASNDFG